MSVRLRTSVSNPRFIVIVVAVTVAGLMLPSGFVGGDRSGAGVGAPVSAPSLSVQSSPALSSQLASGVTPSGKTLNTVVATISGISAPISGTYDPMNGDLYFPNSNAGPLAGSNSSNLTIVDGSSLARVGQIFFGEYSSVQTPTFASAQLFVPVQNSTGYANNLSAVTGTDTVHADIDCGNSSFPTTPVYDPVNHDLYVSDQATENVTALQDNVTVIDSTTDTVVTQILVGLDPTTGVYDPADGDIYVPNSDTSETNLSIINASSNTVILTVGGLSIPTTPAYDPVNQEVYVSDAGAPNVTVLKGTAVVTTIPTGFGPAPPVVDPVNGDVYVPNFTGDNLTVYSPANKLIATINGGTTSIADATPAFDPADNEVYVPAENQDGTLGELDVINTTSNTMAASVTVGSTPGTPTFDPATGDLFSPSFDDNNISVIYAGVSSGPAPRGTYSVAFSETGLPSGAYWNVFFNGTNENETTPTITFPGIANGTHGYSLGPWDDEDQCGLNAKSLGGNVTVAGAPASVPVSFTCSSGGSGSGGSSSASEFLGLPGDEGYLLVGGVAAAAVAAAVAVVKFRPKVPKSGGAPPPGVMPPPPPPPAPPPPPG